MLGAVTCSQDNSSGRGIRILSWIQLQYLDLDPVQDTDPESRNPASRLRLTAFLAHSNLGFLLSLAISNVCSATIFARNFSSVSGNSHRSNQVIDRRRHFVPLHAKTSKIEDGKGRPSPDAHLGVSSKIFSAPSKIPDREADLQCIAFSLHVPILKHTGL